MDSFGTEHKLLYNQQGKELFRMTHFCEGKKRSALDYLCIGVKSSERRMLETRDLTTQNLKFREHLTPNLAFKNT